MQSVLCLDFDGVLCDSIDECFVVAYNAFYDHDISAPSAAPIEAYRFFCRFRYLVAPADDFFLLFHALERGMNHIDRDNFEQLKESTAAARKNFAVRFFEQRRTFKQEMARWQALHRLYEQSRSVLLDDFPDFYVVTTKDRDSVERLAVCHGYRRKVLGIYSRDISTDKQVLFERLFSDAGIKPSTHRIIFVDDNREHLERVKSLELVSRLAGWGYTGPITEGEFPIIHNLKEIDYQSQAFM